MNASSKASTTTAYTINEGESIQLQRPERFKKVYRVEDAGERYQANELGQTEHIPQITFYFHGFPGFLTVDYDAELVTNRKER